MHVEISHANIGRLQAAARAINENAPAFYAAIRDSVTGCLAKDAKERNKAVWQAVKAACNLPEGDSAATAYLRKCKSVIMQAVDLGVKFAEFTTRTALEKAIKLAKAEKAVAEFAAGISTDAPDHVDGTAARMEAFTSELAAARGKTWTAAELIAAAEKLGHYATGPDFPQFYDAAPDAFASIGKAVDTIARERKARKAA